jgi:tellurite resistance protein TerC
VYTSNIFAILGLRSLYFALSGLMPLFRYLKDALAVILGFIGVKMILAEFLPIPIPITLGVIFGLLLIAVIASIVFPEKQAPKAEKQAVG